MTMDSIIPLSSCHPQEHKYSPIRYLHNRLSTYPISNQHRIQEEHTIAHLLHQNNYPPIPPPPREHKSQHRPTSNTKPTQKWAKFTYSGKETRFITKILKKAGLHIAFSARQTIAKLLTYKTDHLNDKYEGSGVYQLTCIDCQKHYVGQTGVHFVPVSRNIHKITDLATTGPILQNIS
jgi:hypothetical protein